MLSRVADAVYWMGRYVERAENTTRLLLVTGEFSTETQGLAEDLAQTAWKELLAAFPGAQLTAPADPAATLAEPYVRSLFADPRNAYSIHHALRKARENARSVREALTVEVFVALNEAYRAPEAAAGRPAADLTALRDGLAAAHKAIFAVTGAIEHTVTRDETWQFLKLGEALERVYRAALILRAKLPALLEPEPAGGSALSDTRWRTLLRALGSLENFRRSRGARFTAEAVVPFLLLDPHSPRSLRHGTGAVQAFLEAIAGGQPGQAARLMGRLDAELRYADDALLPRGDYAALLERTVDVVGHAHDALAAQYFAT